MLAFLYVVAATYFGDRISRRFYRTISIPHRLATSFLVGLLLSTWITYLAAVALAPLGHPLILGNIVFLLVVGLVCYKLPSDIPERLDGFGLRPRGSARWDWILLGALLIFTCWLMFATLNFKDGHFQIGFKSWTDFGANVSLVQSFALGRNFPPQHPFFPGELIRYHFMFWFQAANLEFLGLNPVWSINLLSILSVLALLILVMTFGEVLFNSRVVGRLAAALFFFSTSLSYVPFLQAQTSVSGAVRSIMNVTEFLASGYPFRGETWGVLSANVFGFQRHLISGIGLLFVVMIFVVDRYRSAIAAYKKPVLEKTVEDTSGDPAGPVAEIDGSPTAEPGELVPENVDPEGRNVSSMADSQAAEAEESVSENVNHEDRNVSSMGDSPAAEPEELVPENINHEDRNVSSMDDSPAAEPEKLSPDNVNHHEVQESGPIDDSEAAEPEDLIAKNGNDEVRASFSIDDSQPRELQDLAPENGSGVGRDSIPTGEEGLAWRLDLKAFLFSGAIIGLLPYWNGPTYLSALAIIGCVFLFFPFRLYSACLIGAAVLVGLPQVLLLRSGNVVSYSLYHWGYTLGDPSLSLVLKYLGWTFGVKWILLAVALVFATAFQRKLFIALSSLVVIVFLFQLSTDIFNNHKLLNIWVTFVNVYAAYALWQIAKYKIAGLILAIALTVATVFGGVVDLFPIHNDPMLTVPYQKDRLTQWLLDNTRPSDVFLTHPVLTHPILFAGRKIYLGYTLFAWTAGYNVAEREVIYRRMFHESDPKELSCLLRDNKIGYVAIDDAVRHNASIGGLNEPVYQRYFEKVFEDTGHAYDNLVIYKVPKP